MCLGSQGFVNVGPERVGYLKPGIRPLDIHFPLAQYEVILHFMGPNYLDVCGCDCCLFRVVTKSQLLQALRSMFFNANYFAA